MNNDKNNLDNIVAANNTKNFFTGCTRYLLMWGRVLFTGYGPKGFYQNWRFGIFGDFSGIYQNSHGRAFYAGRC